MTIGVLVLVGWTFDIVAFKGVRPSLATTKPNTALLLVLVGIGTWYAREDGSRRVRRWVGGVVLTVAGLTLVQEACQLDLGIDRILFHDELVDGGLKAGRMSPVTAMNLSLLGLAILGADSGRRFHPGSIITLLAGVSSFLALCGYLYGVSSLYTIGPFSSVALPTTVGFILSCVAYLFARPEVGFMTLVTRDTAAGALVRRLLPAIVLMPSFLGWAILGGVEVGFYDTSFGVALLVLANVGGLGALTWLIASRLNISERERGQVHRQLVESERDLATTLDSIGDGVIATDASGRVIRMNPVAETLIGWSRSEADGRPLAEVFRIVDERSQQPVESPVDQVLREERVVGLANHTALVARDGVTRPIAHSAAPIRVNHSLRGVVLVFRDMTERARMDLELERSAARLAILADSSRDFSAMTGDLGGLLQLVAQRLGQVVGETCVVRLTAGVRRRTGKAGAFYNPDPAVLDEGRRLLVDFLRGQEPGLSDRLGAATGPILIPVTTTDEMLERMPAPWRPLIGRIGLSSLLAVPLSTRTEPFGVLSLIRSRPGNPYTIDDQRMVQDLADRAALAIENAELVADLEDRVAKRTAALEELNREMETFSYSVSHDLRAPLRAIDGFSEALMDDAGDQLTGENRHHLERIRSGAKRMSALIDDLLRLSKIGRGDVRTVPINLTALATGVVGEIRKREPAREVRIEIADGLVGRGDSELVTILLENLFGNAWKFTGKREQAEIAFGRRPDDDSARPVFYVRDNGVGFDMNRSSGLFAPFRRLHKQSDFEGTGIGLATVSRIVKRHGGKVWAEAAINQGATFFFTLGGGA